MEVAKSVGKSANGTAVTQAPRGVRFASRGLRTTEDIGTWASLMTTDILNEEVNHKVATASARMISLTLRAAEFQFRHGGGKPVEVARIDDEAGSPSADPLALREQELLRELNEVRQRREGARKA